MKAFFLLLSAVLGCLGVSPEANAAGKKKPVEVPPLIDGKRTIAVESVNHVRIEMPNQEFQDFGIDYESRLKTRLNSTGRFLVVDPIAPFEVRAKANSGGDIVWTGTHVPAANIRVRVRELSFVTGARGGRMFYGFDEKFRTPFNNGENSLPNEFPLRSVSFEPDWFDRHFDKRGVKPFDSLAGLDLGDGFNLNVLFAWLSVKYARYRAQLKLFVEVDAPLAGRNEVRAVDVKAEGYFFDVAGAYAGYSAGIAFARTDAMRRAVARAIDGSVSAIERGLEGLPLTGRIDNITQRDGETLYLVGTGGQAQIQTGVQFEVVTDPTLVLEVTQSVNSGAVMRRVSGEATFIKPGQILRQRSKDQPPVLALDSRAKSLKRKDLEVAPVVDASDIINLADENIPRPAFKPGETPDVSMLQAVWQSVLGTVLLPYKIYRYAMYDRPYRAYPDGVSGGDSATGPDEDDGETTAPTDGVSAQADWVARSRSEAWAKQIGLNLAPTTRVGDALSAPIVAVIDSGVDYNHPALHAALFLNPENVDRYGWDYVSGDSRPTDDHFHGTETASILTAVEPGARILPVKVFNPWGITNSASIYAAFEYAIARGAKVILCAWATRQPSKAIEMGVAAAQRAGVLVVAAAGDRGDSLRQIAAYPAALATKYGNVIAVAGVDSADRLVTESGRYSNYDAETVSIAAPGMGLRVARPRARLGRATSTGLAAAQVAGAVARLAALSPQAGMAELQNQLFEQSDRASALEGKVAGARRLRVK